GRSTTGGILARPRRRSAISSSRSAAFTKPPGGRAVSFSAAIARARNGSRAWSVPSPSRRPIFTFCRSTKNRAAPATGCMTRTARTPLQKRTAACGSVRIILSSRARPYSAARWPPSARRTKKSSTACRTPRFCPAGWRADKFLASFAALDADSPGHDGERNGGKKVDWNRDRAGLTFGLGLGIGFAIEDDLYDQVSFQAGFHFRGIGLKNHFRSGECPRHFLERDAVRRIAEFQPDIALGNRGGHADLEATLAAGDNLERRGAGDVRRKPAGQPTGHSQQLLLGRDKMTVGEGLHQVFRGNGGVGHGLTADLGPSDESQRMGAGRRV